MADPVSAVRTQPPPMPDPPLDKALTADDLERALRAFHGSYYVEHPFHQRMHAGELTRGQLRAWAANRLAYQRVIPRKDAAILANCPDVGVRRIWVRRILDHDGARDGEGGIELWIRLGVALGVPRAAMEQEKSVIPEVKTIANSYVEFCRTHDWVTGVASSLTELFAPDLMQRRLESLPKHYPWISDDAYGYFRTRLTQAPRDSVEALQIIRTNCKTIDTQRRAFDALRFKLRMLWAMIDAIDLGTRDV